MSSIGLLNCQKEIIYNKYLPYSDKLDEDSNRFLAEIKYNLGRAIVLREASPGILYWCNRLTKWVLSYTCNYRSWQSICGCKICLICVLLLKQNGPSPLWIFCVVCKTIKLKSLHGHNELAWHSKLFSSESLWGGRPGYLIVPHPRIIAPNIPHPKHFGVNPKYINAVCAPSSNLQCY